MISVVNPSVNDFLASYLENNEPDKQETLKNSISVSPLYRLMNEEQREATLLQLFANGEILNYVFEDEQDRIDFITGYCAEHQVMDIRYQPFIMSYIRNMHDIITPDGLRLHEQTMTLMWRLSWKTIENMVRMKTTLMAMVLPVKSQILWQIG